MSTLTPMVQAVKNLDEMTFRTEEAEHAAKEFICNQEVERHSKRVDFYESMDRKITLWELGRAGIGHDNEAARKHRKLLEELTEEELSVLQKCTEDYNGSFANDVMPIGSNVEYFFNYDGHKFSGDLLKLYDRAWAYYHHTPWAKRSVEEWYDIIQEEFDVTLISSLEAVGIEVSFGE